MVFVRYNWRVKTKNVSLYLIRSTFFFSRSTFCIEGIKLPIWCRNLDPSVLVRYHWLLYILVGVAFIRVADGAKLEFQRVE